MAATKDTQMFADKFSGEEYALEKNVPVLDEHERDDGYVGEKELKTVVEENNYRIRDTGDFVPLILEHTPDSDEKAKGAKTPDIVGWAGPFRMGKIGNEDPRHCIYAENWAVYKDRLAEVKKHPRRSVELWLEDGKPKFMDPIALLGAETPRRALGLKLAAGRDGMICEAYEMALPGGGTNTFIRSFGDKDKEPYQMDDAQIQKLVATLENTDVFQFVRNLMAEQAAPVDAGAMPPDAGAMPPEDAASVDATMDTAPGMDEEQYAEDTEDKDDDEMDETKDDYESDDEDKDKDKDKDKDEYKKSNSSLRARYRRKSKEVNQWKDKYAAIEQRVGQLEQGKLRAERHAVLQGLEHEGYQLNPDEEIEDVIGLNEKAWTRHEQRIRDRYTRVPVGHQLPKPVGPDKYQAQPEGDQSRSEKAVQIAQRDGVDFNTAYDQAGQ
jgi:hypothetical protein